MTVSRDRQGLVKVSEVLGGFLAGSEIQSGMRRAAVLLDWPERVGPRIAAVTRPRSVSGGTLFVEVRSSAWRMELELLRAQILSRVNQGCGDAPVDEIVYVLSAGPWGEAGSTPSAESSGR